MKRGSRYLILSTASLAVALTGVLALPAIVPQLSSWVSAQQSSSTNYSVNEVYFGSGGELNPCSTNYCSKQSAGELTVGNTSSTNYQAQGGFNTEREEYLQLTVDDTQCPGAVSPTINLGTLSTSSTTTGSENFSVKSYLASGYVVQTVGSPPASSGPSPHTLTTSASPTTSAVGTEQFGINLRANTSPSIGADPTQLPSSSFSYGAVSSGYNTVNNFKYGNGDAIASSSQSSGTTCFDMSYIFNISPVTPAGEYHFSQSIVATSTY